MDRVQASSGTLQPSLGCFSGLLCLCLLLLPGGKVYSQTPSDRVLGFLDSASGFHLLGSIHEGVLSSGESMAVYVPLSNGAEYMVVGYCDDGCTNIDLVLFDSAGGEVQADRLPDPEPVLMHTAEATGPFYIQLQAVECATGGCDVAVGVLGKTGEPGVPPGEDMSGRLNLIGTELLSAGFVEVLDEWRFSLNSDQAIKLPVTLQDSLEYRMVGVCDIDCFDLDLALLDSAGAEVVSDYFQDAVPILAHRPDTTGGYQLEVIMVACDVEPCAVRVATYAKGEDPWPAGTTSSGEMLFQETFHGELGPEDERLSGAYLDVYRFEARPGQRIVVDLRSDDFDTLLRVLDPDGEGDESVQYRGGTGHSHAEMIALKQGSYSILVSSALPDSAGAYVLQIALVE